MDTKILLADVFRELAPYIMTVASSVIMVLLAWIGKAVKSWTGLELENSHRVALHSAAVTGIHAALARAGQRLDGLSIDTRSYITAATINWIITNGAPRAVEHFGLTPENLSALVDAKLSQLLIDSKVPIAPPAATAAA